MPYSKQFKVLRPKTDSITTKSVTETTEVSIERITLAPIRDMSTLVGGSVSQTVRVFDFYAENYKADIQHGDILESTDGKEESYRVTDIRLHDLGSGQSKRLVGSANLVR